MKFILPILFFAVACSTKEKYDVSNFFDPKSSDSIRTKIVTFLFEAPPYTKMKDRFAMQHYPYYASIASRFSIEKFFIANDGTHFFYIIRPAPSPTQKRGVGGHFKLSGKNEIIEFREEFVTPILPESEVKQKGLFLFEEMLKGNLKEYLKMESYVQWPNKISYYDTTTYEWKLKPEMIP